MDTMTVVYGLLGFILAATIAAYVLYSRQVNQEQKRQFQARVDKDTQTFLTTLREGDAHAEWRQQQKRK